MSVCITFSPELIALMQGGDSKKALAIYDKKAKMMYGNVQLCLPEPASTADAESQTDPGPAEVISPLRDEERARAVSIVSEESPSRNLRKRAKEVSAGVENRLLLNESRGGSLETRPASKRGLNEQLPARILRSSNKPHLLKCGIEDVPTKRARPLPSVQKSRSTEEEGSSKKTHLYRCSNCDKSFNCSIDLTRHRNQCKLNQSVPIKFWLGTPTKSGSASSRKALARFRVNQLKCTKCSLCFQSVIAFYRHKSKPTCVSVVPGKSFTSLPKISIGDRDVFPRLLERSASLIDETEADVNSSLNNPTACSPEESDETQVMVNDSDSPPAQDEKNSEGDDAADHSDSGVCSLQFSPEGSTPKHDSSPSTLDSKCSDPPCFNTEPIVALERPHFESKDNPPGPEKPCDTPSTSFTCACDIVGSDVDSAPVWGDPSGVNLDTPVKPPPVGKNTEPASATDTLQNARSHDVESDGAALRVVDSVTCWGVAPSELDLSSDSIVVVDPLLPQSGARFACSTPVKPDHAPLTPFRSPVEFVSPVAAESSSEDSCDRGLSLVDEQCDSLEDISDLMELPDLLGLSAVHDFPLQLVNDASFCNSIQQLR